MDYQTAREHALERDRVCQNCGSNEDLHAHHIVPRSEGGPDTPENLVILCKYCHPKFEGTDEVPRFAGNGAKIDEVVGELEIDTIAREALKEIKHGRDIFKMIQRDPGICANCFRRFPGVASLDDRIKVATHSILMSDLNATFKEIQSDPDVCSNCFRRTHDRYERNYRLETTQVEDEDGKMQWTKIPVSVEGLEITLPDGSTEVIGGMDDDVFRIDDSTMEIPEDGAHRGITHVCVCGFRWGPEEVIDEWKNRPLDKRTFFEYADHLLDRLRESNVGLDEDVFMEELDRLKSNPDQQFADDRIYSNAIEYASSLETVRDTA